jgi:thiamine pyrophosphokinase
MSTKDQIVILANGSFPGTPHGLDLLKNAGVIICCDGAADKLLAFGMEPQAIIGDLDSISDRTREKYASILVQSGDQESNDLTKAVRYCVEQGYPSVSILGATGLREDHTLGNISLMLEYAPHIEVRIISDYGIFFLVRSGEVIQSEPGEMISIFSIDRRTTVSSTGLKYPLDNLPLSHWYTASLNEATGKSFSLLFDSELPLIVYRAW